MKTDSQLQHDVMAELKWEPSVHAENIGVEVRHGVVALSGHVDSYAEKWSAEHAAKRVSGVNSLTVDINVRLSPSSQRSDADIARTAENILQWTSSLPRNAIRLMVEKGWITLTGQVEWDFQRLTAAAAVRHLMGVTGVSDQITLKPLVSFSAAQLDIERALKRRAKTNAEAISVVVRGANVILSGTVNSWSERELAAHSAWSAPGVHKVIDNIAVSF